MDRISLDVANLELDELSDKYSGVLKFTQPLRVVFLNNDRLYFKVLCDVKDVSIEVNDKFKFSFDATRDMFDQNKDYICSLFNEILNSRDVVGKSISNPLLDGINESVLPPSAYDVLRYLKEVNNKNISNMLVTFSVSVEKYISDIKDTNKKEKSFEIELTPEMSNNIRFREILEHLGYTLFDTVDKETSRTFVCLPLVN